MMARLPGAPAEAERLIELRGPVDLNSTLWPLAHGGHDPTIRFTARGVWRAWRTRAGAATLHLKLGDRCLVRAHAWGPGAEAAVDSAAALVGALDEPDSLVPRHRLIAELVRRNPGLRLPRSGQVLEALVPAILEQKVTGTEARRAFRALVIRYGEAAPGPAGLRLLPSMEIIAALPYPAFHLLGVERRRAEVIRFVAAHAGRLVASATSSEAGVRLRAVAGIGPWTAAEVLRVAWGDPDAISVGDYHVPNLVAWALAGEPRADDARMLELLEPYRGQRGRVQRLLEVSGIRIPRYGPRMAPRSIAGI